MGVYIAVYIRCHHYEC